MVKPLPIERIHHVELVVGNARQAAFYYRKALGFSQIAYRGPETGTRDRASYVMAQGDIRLVLTTPLLADAPMSEHIKQHGDGVWEVVFQVDNVDAVYGEAVARGARPSTAPSTTSDGHDTGRGRVRRASIHAYGDTTHAFVHTGRYQGPFLPGFEADEEPERGVGLERIDHIVANVEDGKMNDWVGWYERVFGFHQFLSFDDKDISTEFTALRSKVMSSDRGALKFPINEPAQGRGKSQIQEYVEAYGGAGVQHIALHTSDIIGSVSRLRERGLDFLKVPETYYETIWDRVGPVAEDHDALRKLGILIDRDDEGYLLQLFTQPVQDRPTLFFELIQRNGAQGFGKGNFRSLFESIEHEQRRRGNL